MRSLAHPRSLNRAVGGSSVVVGRSLGGWQSVGFGRGERQSGGRHILPLVDGVAVSRCGHHGVSVSGVAV